VTDDPPPTRKECSIEVETIDAAPTASKEKPEDERDEYLQDHGGIFMEPTMNDPVKEQERKHRPTPPPPPHPPPDHQTPKIAPTPTIIKKEPGTHEPPEPIQPPYHPSRIRTSHD
jgi:hypothetical protein